MFIDSCFIFTRIETKRKKKLLYRKNRNLIARLLILIFVLLSCFLPTVSAQTSGKVSAIKEIEAGNDSSKTGSIIDNILGKTSDLAKSVKNYSSEKLVNLAKEVKKSISFFDSRDSDLDIKIGEKIHAIRIMVDKFAKLKKKEQKASGFSLFSPSKKDYRIKTNKILKELEPVLFDGEVMNYSERIQRATQRIDVLNLEMAELTEKKFFSNPDNIVVFKAPTPIRLERYEEKIKNREEAIKELELLIKKVENDLIKKFDRLGIKVTESEVRVLTKRVDGDDLFHTIAVFDITKQISNNLSKLIVSTKFEPEYTQKYYGIILIMAEMTLYAQQIYSKKIEDIYLPALNKVKSDINDAIRFAEKTTQKGTNDSNKKILLQNIKSNELSNEVIKFYRKILTAQASQLHKAMKESKSNIDVAYSIYDTAAISSNLVNLIDTTQGEFDKILKVQLPPIIPFSSVALEKRFTEISNRINLESLKK